MAETVVENLICEACGSEIRDASAFCFNCGESILDESDEFIESDPSESDAANARLDEKMSEAWKDDDSVVTAEDSIGETEDDGENSVAERRTKLRTAASLRKRAKALKRRPVRVVWEEPAQPSRLFMVVSIGLTLFAAAMLFLALYLK